MLHMSSVFQSCSQENPSSTGATSTPSAPVSSSSTDGADVSALSPRRETNPVDLTLYAVTDSALTAKLGQSMEEAVAAAVAGGATVIQIREKNATTADFIEFAR
jgi:Thiamine monophosphate synthase